LGEFALSQIDHFLKFLLSENHVFLQLVSHFRWSILVVDFDFPHIGEAVFVTAKKPLPSGERNHADHPVEHHDTSIAHVARDLR
jgi:hypothetical protein